MGKHCTNCGHELKPGLKFCTNCGKQISQDQSGIGGPAKDAFTEAENSPVQQSQVSLEDFLELKREVRRLSELLESSRLNRLDHVEEDQEEPFASTQEPEGRKFGILEIVSGALLSIHMIYTLSVLCSYYQFYFPFVLHPASGIFWGLIATFLLMLLFVIYKVKRGAISRNHGLKKLLFGIMAALAIIGFGFGAVFEVYEYHYTDHRDSWYSEASAHPFLLWSFILLFVSWAAVIALSLMKLLSVKKR